MNGERCGQHIPPRNKMACIRPLGHMGPCVAEYPRVSDDPAADDLRPCRLAPAGWRCTRGGGHEGPCAAVPDLSVDGLARYFGVPAASRGSQVDPDMALPSKTPEEHGRATPQHPEAPADGATIYQEALVHAAFYVHDHCQQGKEHASVICDLKIPERYTKQSAATPQHSVNEQASDLTTAPCPTCNGRCGERKADAWHACDDCDGQGRVIVRRSDIPQPLASTAATQPEQASTVLIELCDQLDGLRRRLRHTPGTGQNHSYLLHEDVAECVAEARAALAIPASTAASERIKARFANRPRSPATADFDLPAPNDAASEQQPSVSEADKRPWRYNCEDGKHFVESADFTHDVRLYINGDFAHAEEREAYGEWLASKLNAALSGRATIPSDADERYKARAPYRSYSVDGKQHDTGRVVTKGGNFFATTGSPEDAKVIADALNAARTHRATTATCDTCDGNGAVGFPPDRYEPCPECAPQATPDTATTASASLPRWIDDLKGSDPTIDSLIAYIDRRAQQGAAQAQAGDTRHPIQPLIIDPHGCIRFKRNAIVDHLANGKLNDLAAMDFPQEDWEQLAQLIGYSLSGFGELSYVTDETYERAAMAAPATSK